MYVLDYLKVPKRIKPESDLPIFEYRLLCSGELYNGNVLTAEWRKSDACRILTVIPFELTVVSQPFDEYPQELALRFKMHETEEKKENVSHSFFADDEIANDLAAFLSLLCRRLITVAAKVRVIYPVEFENTPEAFRDWPVSFTSSMKRSFWEHKPATVIYGAKGIESITDYNPPPKTIDPAYFNQIFSALPNLKNREDIVLSIRLYATGLELMEKHPEFSYQAFISSIETIASSLFSSYEPDDLDKINLKRHVFKLGKNFGLSEDQAKQMAIAACQGYSWNLRKFVKFLLDYVDDELWADDDVFKAMQNIYPKKEQYESVLKKIYRMRNKTLHAGRPYPLSGKIGMHPMVPSKLLLELDNLENLFPPITWFERVVNIALRTFLERSAGLDSNSLQVKDER